MTINKSLNILIPFFVAFANFWIWRITNIDPLFSFVLISLSIILFYLFNTYKKILLLISILLLVFISIKVLISGFDNNFNVLNPDQQKQLNQRHGYYATDLGILFGNRFVLHFYKDISPYLNIYSSNIFNSLSPNLYFFINHPREREGVQEFSMYHPIFIIPFLVGMIFIFNSLSYLICGYIVFTLVITGFIKQSYTFGPIIFFPLINLFISIGILKIFKFLIRK